MKGEGRKRQTHVRDNSFILLSFFYPVVFFHWVTFFGTCITAWFLFLFCLINGGGSGPSVTLTARHVVIG